MTTSLGVGERVIVVSCKHEEFLGPQVQPGERGTVVLVAPGEWKYAHPVIIRLDSTGKNVTVLAERLAPEPDRYTK